ncbi:MAG TPA: DUF2207 domain-containing protein [Acidimicrobiia bacterium]|nr:DUF2207 domain-containing protein [Acidimicrobiia bacterium]
MRARRAAALAPVMVLVVVIACAVVALGAGPATAGPNERILDYRSDVTIGHDGTIEVHETIVYDFGVVPHHGIFRSIPVRTDQSGKDGYDRVYPLTVVSVTGSADTPAQYTVEDDGDLNRRIKIGDPDRTITGEHTYDIVYRVRGAMNTFADHDELVWNAIGPEWSVPIEQASAVVHAPADIQKVFCATGQYGALDPCDTSNSRGTTADFSKAPLDPFNGMTFTVALPKGAVVPPPKPILEERFSVTSAFRVTPATGGIAGAMLALLALIVIFLIWKFGRDRRYAGSAVDAAYGEDGGPEVAAPLHEAETPVEFEPPEELRPGELGTLIDFVAGPLDVTATIIDLAVRGYLKIEEVDKEWYQFKHDWKLTKVPQEGQLRQYERSLYSGLFKDGDEVKLSELENTFAGRMSKVREQLMDDAMSKGWFSRKPGTVKVLWGLLGIVVLAAGIALTILLAAETHAALVGVPVIVAGVLLLVASRWMPKRTAKGYSVLRHTLGFKRFIDESEKHRAQFAERANIFSEYLPYAVVFGATDKWAKAFADLGNEPDTSSWYVSQHAFDYAVFSSAIDGFATTSAGTLTSSPASTGSSGFSGGGFSGGGGGGGGGGSW